MKLFLYAALAAGIVAATPAQAVTFTLNGTTAGGPTYNRPLAGVPPTGLSGVGTAVAYSTLAFTVDTAGSYAFLNSSLYDNFLSLYSGSFNAASPLTNALVVNDDLLTVGNAGFTRTLSTGISYIAVMSSFNNADKGAFTLTIDGPGNVLTGGAAPAVPEPATWAMMLVGMGFAGAAMRRTKVRTTRVRYA